MDADAIATVEYSAEGVRWEMARRPPHPALASYVHDYCGYEEQGAEPIRRLEVATGQVTVIVSFGDPLDIVSMTNTPRPSGRFGSFLVGLHEGYAITEAAGHQRGVEIGLTPLGAYRLFGIPMEHVANQVIELEALGGRTTQDLTERLSDAAGWGDRFALVDELLLGWADQGPEPHPAVAWAWWQLARSHGRVAIGSLVDEIGWSRRHFTSRFRAQVGLAPKPTGRVLRFRRAFELLSDDGQGTISDVAAACGYADHSHLVRDFHALAGRTPSAVVAGRMPSGGGVAG